MFKTELDYNFCYVIVCALTFIFSFLFNSRHKWVKHLFPITFITILSYIIGSRPLDIGTDTEMYYIMFNSIESTFKQSIFQSLGHFATEPIFFTILFIGSFIGDYNIVLTIISFLTLFFAYLFCVRLCKILKIKRPLALLCCYLVSFYVFSQQINIIRVGLASTILLNYYLSVFENQKKFAIIYGILAIGIHFTSVIGIISCLIAKLFNLGTKKLLLIYFGVIILSYFNFGILNIGIDNYIDLGRRASYLTDKSLNYITGFRVGFTLFNTVFLLFFCFTSQRKSNLYNMMLRLFVYLSCIFFFCFQIPYSDRFGGFSWNLIAFLSFLSLYKNWPKKETFALVSTFILMITTTISINLIS